MTSEYQKDHAENPCTICKSPPGTFCVVVEPSISDVDGSIVNCWVAQLVGDGLHHTTQAATPVDALFAAYELLRLLVSKCAPEDVT